MLAPLLAAIALAQAASAAVPPPASPPAAANAPATTPAAGEDLAFADAAERMTVAVSVADRGPFAFVIDTGAERSVLSHELASELALPPGPTVTLLTMAGQSPAPTVVVPAVSVGRTSGHDLVVPVLQRYDMGALGILGLDLLQNKLVTIDFENHRLTVAPSTPRRRLQSRSSDEIVVTARNLFGQLVVTEAYYRGRHIRVVLDTGSEISIGNAAMQALVMHGRTTETRTPVIAVTGQRVDAAMDTLRELQVGGLQLRDLPIAFTDAPPFAHFGLAHYPALMLGMNTLRAFRRVEIDFSNRQVRFLLPRSDGFGITTNGGSRVN